MTDSKDKKIIISDLTSAHLCKLHKTLDFDLKRVRKNLKILVRRQEEIGKTYSRIKVIALAIYLSDPLIIQKELKELCRPRNLRKMMQELHIHKFKKNVPTQNIGTCRFFWTRKHHFKQELIELGIGGMLKKWKNHLSSFSYYSPKLTKKTIFIAADLCNIKASDFKDPKIKIEFEQEKIKHARQEILSLKNQLSDLKDTLGDYKYSIRFPRNRLREAITTLEGAISEIDEIKLKEDF